MFNLVLPVQELILRAVVIYFGVFFLFRVIGKKQLGQMSPFDFVLLLIVSESISNGLSAKDDSVTGGLISAITLIGLSAIIDRLSFKFRKFEKFVEGEAQLLIIDGKVNRTLQNKFKITDDEILESLHDREIEKVSEVKRAFLEANGRITVLKF